MAGPGIMELRRRLLSRFGVVSAVLVTMKLAKLCRGSNQSALDSKLRGTLRPNCHDTVLIATRPPPSNVMRFASL